MIHWLWTAVNTYLLHSQHGNGYAFWSSGPGPGLGQIALLGGLAGLYRHINCEQPGCPWPGHRHPDHGRPVCRKHYHHDVMPRSPDSENFQNNG